MTELDPKLFADPPARDARFDVKQVWSEMQNMWADDGTMLVEFMHRQMNEEVNGLEIAARNLTDFPDAPWELRLAIARQCWDESRHVLLFRRSFEARGGRIGEFPVMNFEFRMITAIPTLIGRLAVQNRSFEAAGVQAITGALEHADEYDPDVGALLEGQLADEIQHVRYADRWIKELVARNKRNMLDLVRGVAQANQAFPIIAGPAAIDLQLGEDLERELGLADAVPA